MKEKCFIFAIISSVKKRLWSVRGFCDGGPLGAAWVGVPRLGAGLWAPWNLVISI